MSSTAVSSHSSAEPIDLRDSDAYVRLEQVFSQLDSPQVQMTPDWQHVIDSADELLARHTDLRIVCWRIFALRQLQQTSHAAAAMLQLSDTVASAWNSCLPARERAKLAALHWLHAAFSRELSASSDAASELASLQTAAHRLASALLSHSAELSHNWQQLAALLQPPASAPSASPNPETDTPKTPTADPISTTRVCNARDAQQQLRRLQEAAVPLLEWWVSQPERRGCAVQLNRALTWAGICQLPQHDQSQRTSLRPPPAERRNHCEALWQRAEYPALLTTLEASLRKAPFWLDGHCLAARCCEALQDHQAAAAIREQVRLLLQMQPGLEQLCFDDGTPFATKTTRRWLAPAESSVSPPLTETETTDLLALQGSDGFPAAAQALAQQLQTPKGERQRAVCRLQLARLLLVDGQCKQARELLEPQLTQLQQSMPLPLWDQQLLSDTLDLLQQSLADQRDESARRRRSALQQQLRWLNLEHTLDQAARPAQYGEI